jgi:hypothetical protein
MKPSLTLLWFEEMPTHVVLGIHAATAHAAAPAATAVTVQPIAALDVFRTAVLQPNVDSILQSQAKHVF